MEIQMCTVTNVDKTYQRIHALRAAHSLTQDEVAARSGLRRTEISRLESAKQINQATSDRVRAGLAKAFEVGRDDIADYLEGRLDLDGIMQRKTRKRVVELDIQDEELFRAVHFLRGQMPDEFLDEVTRIKFYGGNRFSRDQLLLMIRERFAQWKQNGTQDDSDEITQAIERERSR